MKKLSRIALIAVFQCYGCIGTAQSAAHRNDNVFTPAQLREDYRILLKTLREAYPSTYRYNTKRELDAFFDSMVSRLNVPMTEREFYPLIALTAAQMKDEHIIPTPSGAYYSHTYQKHTRFLPFSIKVINRQMYINVSNDPHLKTGSQVISINNVPTGVIIQKVIRYIHRDGNISTFLYRHLEDYSPTQNENIFDLDYSFLYRLKNKVELTVKVPGGKTTKLSLPSLNYSEYQSFYWKRNPHELPLSFKQLDDSIAFLQVSSFHPSYRENYKQDFDTLFKQVFARLDSSKAPNLIIDLRRCEGGDNTYLRLLQYLMLKPFRVLDYIEVAYAGMPSTAKYFESTDNAFFPDSLLYRTVAGKYRLKSKYQPTIAGYTDTYPQPQGFKGNLYVLTSGATGSAAAIFCSILRNAHRALFIGEETGGAMEGPTSLNIPILVLPNSKIRIEVPLIRLRLAVQYTKGRGVIPDYPVEQTANDLIRQQDAQLNFALYLLHKH